MLQTIRDRTHGWIAGIIITLLIMAFAMWGISSYLGGSGPNDTVAKVNGEEISKRQLSMAFEPMRNQAQMTSGGILSAQAQDTLRQQALNLLINIQVLKQASLDQHYKIAYPQIDGYIKQMPQFQVDGQFSASRLQQVLASNMVNPTQFIDSIGTTLLIDQPRLGIVLTSFALPYEIATTIALTNQQRDIEYLTIPKTQFAKDISVTPQDIQAYYDQHKEDYKTLDQISIDYIQLSVNDLIKNIVVSDDAIKKAYDDNANSYAEPKQWKIAELLIPIKDMTKHADVDAAKKQAQQVKQSLAQGADVDKLMKQYPASAKSPKADEWLSLDRINPALQKPVSDLKKKGDVTEPVETIEGLLIAKLVDVKEPKNSTFAESKDKVKAELQRQKAEELFADSREKLANLTYETPTSLDSAAKNLALQVNHTGYFTKDHGDANAAKDDITQNQKVREVAFSNDVLVSQNNSDVIQISPDTAVVVRVKEHKPASILPLKNVEKQISDKLQVMQSEMKAKQIANEIVSELQKGTTSQQITDKYHVVWSDAGYVGRYDSKVDSAILYGAFQLAKPDNGKNVFAAVKVPAGFAVVAVTGVKQGATTVSSEQNDAYVDQIQNSQGALEYLLYEKSLMRAAKITTYTDNQG